MKVTKTWYIAQWMPMHTNRWRRSPNACGMYRSAKAAWAVMASFGLYKPMYRVVRRTRTVSA